MNNRSAGLRFERMVVRLLADAFGLRTPAQDSKDYQIATTRLQSKAMDDRGIDIWCCVPPLSEYSIQIFRRQRRRTKKGAGTGTVSIDKLMRIADMPNPIMIVGDYGWNGKRKKLLGIYVLALTQDSEGAAPRRGRTVPLREGKYLCGGVAITVQIIETFIKKLTNG